VLSLLAAPLVGSIGRPVAVLSISSVVFFFDSAAASLGPSLIWFLYAELWP